MAVWTGPKAAHFGKVSLFQVGANFVMFFPSRKCQISTALNTKSTVRRNKAQSPTHVGLLRFLKSPAANECQQNPQSASFSSNTDADRDKQGLRDTGSSSHTGS